MINKIKTFFLVLSIVLHQVISAIQQKNFNEDNAYHDLLNFMHVQLSSSVEYAIDRCKQILDIIKKVQVTDQCKDVNNLAKNVLKVFLTNGAPTNIKYKFDKGQNTAIKNINDTFMKHIKKHFSTEDGVFSSEGKHSRILKGSGKESLSDNEIVEILDKLIEQGTFQFVVNNNILLIRLHRAAQVADITAGYSVYKLQGNKGDNFSSVKQEDASKELDNLEFFFELHMCKTQEDMTNSNSGGRFGSVYVRNKMQI